MTGAAPYKQLVTPSAVKFNNFTPSIATTSHEVFNLFVSVLFIYKNNYKYLLKIIINLFMIIVLLLVYNPCIRSTVIRL
jgi:hypothetical protein